MQMRGAQRRMRATASLVSRRRCLRTRGVTDAEHDEALAHLGVPSARLDGVPGARTRAEEDALAGIVHMAEHALEGG
eukprot:2758924-Alexandrium_andersonii.AAC.1